MGLKKIAGAIWGTHTAPLFLQGFFFFCFVFGKKKKKIREIFFGLIFKD